MNKKYCNYNTPYNVWLSLEDYYTPYWVPDSFMEERILVCNKEEFTGEGFRCIPTPMRLLTKLHFDSVYGEDGDVEVATHFMIIASPQS
jgi:hypothetical protein